MYRLWLFQATAILKRIKAQVRCSIRLLARTHPRLPSEDKAGIVEIGIEPEANLDPVARPSVKDSNGITLFAKGKHMRRETMKSPAQLQPS